jgi:hypothetical protein
MDPSVIGFLMFQCEGFSFFIISIGCSSYPCLLSPEDDDEMKDLANGIELHTRSVLGIFLVDVNTPPPKSTHPFTCTFSLRARFLSQSCQ